MTRIRLQILKTAGAFCVAFAILSLLFAFYGLIPVHIDNPQGNTDYVWPPHARWMKMSEGVSWGRLDANGFNNKAVIDNPDILIVGSSHMESMNVMQEENTASQLTHLLNGRHSVYNLGISGHNFLKACQYLPRNIELYKPKGLKTIVIETSTVDVSQKDVDAILNHGIKKTPNHAHGLIGKMQRNPFLRTLYFQYEHGLTKVLSPPQIYNCLRKKKGKKPVKQLDTSQHNSVLKVDDSGISKLFAWLSALQNEHHVRIIIFHHPFETLMKDGSVSFGDMEKTTAFGNMAKNHGIVFVDMGKAFERMFNEEHHVPHGFATGKLGVGHLNAYGQATVAKELAKIIDDLDSEGALVP